MAEDEKSLTWVVVRVMSGIAVFGWGFLAGSYDGTHYSKLSEMSAAELEDVDTRSRRSWRGRRDFVGEAVYIFVGNAIQQLPNLPTVISWHITNRIWLPITIVVLEVGALLGASSMKKLESALKKPKRRP